MAKSHPPGNCALWKGTEDETNTGSSETTSNTASEGCSRKLRKPPTHRLIEAWEAYVSALSETLPADSREALRADAIGRVTKVAEAAGGFFGLGRKTPSSEQKVLDRLQKFFSRAG